MNDELHDLYEELYRARAECYERIRKGRQKSVMMFIIAGFFLAVLLFAGIALVAA